MGRKQTWMEKNLSLAQLEQAKSDLMTGATNLNQIALKYETSRQNVVRWWELVPEEEKRRALANAKVRAIEEDTQIINDERLDVGRTYESLARRVEKLITRAEENDDDSFALSAMEGLRKVLRDIATMHGKMAQSLTVEVKIAESAEWVRLRTILKEVVDEVPGAREPLLRRMRRHALSVAEEARDAI